MSSDKIYIRREVAEQFIKSMDTLTDCMAASYAMHVEIKAALVPQIKYTGDCGCYRDEWGKFITCVKCYSTRND